MSERKVLQKYYPPTFDPSAITRTKKPKGLEKKLPTVRLMAPFPMRCTSCGEFIYKGRKFNARKETTDEKYLAIAIYRFWIKCTACSSSISFKTNPRTMDYDCESGAQRSFERWRSTGEENANNLETEEEMLDRLESEAAEANDNAMSGAMGELERKVEDAKTEMEIADALDEIRMRNARIQRAESGKDGDGKGAVLIDQAVEAAERAFAGRLDKIPEDEVDAHEAVKSLPPTTRNMNTKLGGGAGGGSSLRNEIVAYNDDDDDDDNNNNNNNSININININKHQPSSSMPPPPPPHSQPSQQQQQHQQTFKRTVKKKKDFSAALGIKKKEKPALV